MNTDLTTSHWRCSWVPGSLTSFGPRDDAMTGKEHTMGRLKDKIVLVTGAAGAIGSATADAVVENGGIAITTDLGGNAGMDHALDVTSQEDWLRVVAEIERAVGRLDGLLNAAGIAAAGSVEDTDLATWRRGMGGDLAGTFLGRTDA